jgi:hypothetical protein
MMKVEYKGYRVWAILQTSGKFRAWFFNSPVSVMADVSPVIEGDTEAQAINKAIQFIDQRLQQRRPLWRSVVAGGWAI